MIFRFIFFAILVFIILKVVRYIYNNLLKPSSEPPKPKVHTKSKTSGINKDDIIEAKFEDINGEHDQEKSN